MEKTNAKKELKEFNKLKNDLRTKVFLDNEYKIGSSVLNKQFTLDDLAFANVFLMKLFGNEVCYGYKKIEKYSSWNLKLNSEYSKLKELLEIGLKSDNQNEMLERYKDVLKTVFLIQALAKKNKENDFMWLKEEVEYYFKNCIIEKKEEDKVIFKSKKIKIVASWLNHTVELIEKSSGLKQKSYIKKINPGDVDLFKSAKEVLFKFKK
jgi:hypothetical protein